MRQGTPGVEPDAASETRLRDRPGGYEWLTRDEAAAREDAQLTERLAATHR